MRIVGRIAAGLALLIVVVVGAALGYRAWRQHEIALAQEIHSPNGIDEESFVKIGGVEQWVSIRGQDKNNPVLLYVSGGPGDSMIPFGYAIFPEWEKSFTVVNWDQRGAGLTYIHNGRDASQGLSVPQMTADTIELAQYLRDRLHKKKIVLLGWSWGSILGIEAVHARPDLFAVYVGTGQLVSGRENESVGYSSLLARAEAAHDTATVAKLKEIGPPPYATTAKMLTERGLLGPYTPLPERDAFTQAVIISALAPGYGPRDAYDAGIAAPLFSIGKLWDAVMAYNVRHLGTHFDAPIVIIDGADDIQVPESLARSWFATLDSPQKDFIALPDAAHMAPVAQSGKFFRALNTKVRPLAIARGA